MMKRHIPVTHGIFRTLVLIAALHPAWLSADEPAPLNSFPTAKRLWLCHINGEMNASRLEEAQSQGIGKLRILAADNAQVHKDEIYAVFRPEQLELELESLDLEKKFLAKKISETRMAHEETILGLEAKKAEAQMSLQEFKTALELPEVINDSELKKGVELGLEKSKESLERIEERLRILSDPAILNAEIRQLEIDYRKLELEHQNARHLAEFRAPFDGRLSLGPEIMEEHGEKETPFDTWIRSGEQIARITDNSSYQVVINSYPALLNHTPKTDLVLELKASNGEKPLTARFLEIRKDPVARPGNGGRQALVFQIVSADYDRAETMTGTSANGRMYQELPGKCHIVSKSKMVKLLGDRKRKPGGWDEFAKSIWPEVELVAVGHLEIALRHPGNQSSPSK